MKRYSFLIIGFLGGIIIWPLDAIIDVVFFAEESIIEELFHPSALEIYFRSVVMLFLFAFAIFAHFSTKKNRVTTSLLSALRDGIPDLIFYKDKDGVYLGCNQAFCDLVGKASESEIIGITDHDLFDKELADFFRQKDNDMLASGASKHNDEWVTYPDGRRVLLDTLKTPFRDNTGKVIGILGISRDITDSRLIAENLERSRYQLGLILHSAGEGIYGLDTEGLATFVNPAAAHMFGWEIEELLGQNMHEVMHHTKRDGTPLHDEQCLIHSTFKHGVIHTVTDDLFFRKDGSSFSVDYVSTPMLEDGKLSGSVITFNDISERKETERKSIQLFQAVQQAGEAVMMTDRNGVIEYVNPAFTSITGYAPDEIIGQTPAMLKSSAQDPAFYKELWDTITRGEVWHGTLIDRKKDGSFYPAMMSVAPIHDDSGDITHFVSLQQDMSEYKTMEDQFLQAQKMEAIGTLVGGIAHDFNNMLAAIQGNVYLSKQKLKDRPDVVEKLDSIEMLGMRAADMVKQLLTFARKDRVAKSTFSLNVFFKEAFKLAKTSVPENIELICDPCQEELIISGDATQLQQVLMNLLNNARDAVSDVAQPSISCSLRLFIATDAFAKAHSDMKGDRFAQLVIRDNGAGISKEHVNKVFEPFFTTKGVGEGTGLGLAMVYGAVQSHGGIIDVDSDLGMGTTFSIYLPLSTRPITTEADASIIAHGHGETILLVDDEESMRATTAEVLSSLGYRVLIAEDGEEGLALFKVHSQDIALILTDIVMPRMGGIELAKAIRQLDKDMPIIFATGYDKDSAISTGDQVAQSTVINKPFSFTKLSQLIRKMMGTD